MMDDAILKVGMLVMIVTGIAFVVRRGLWR